MHWAIPRTGLALALLGAAAPASAQTASPAPGVQRSDRDIVGQSQLAYGDPDGVTFRLQVTRIPAGAAPEHLETMVHTRGKDVLVTYLAPRGLRGEKLLIKGSNVWFLSHNYQEPVAISPRQRRAGAAAYADIASKDFVDDYTIKRLPDEVRNGVDCYVFELNADPSIPFSYVLYWVRKNDLMPFAGRFLSRSQQITYMVNYEINNTILRNNARAPFVSKITIEGVDETTVLDYTEVRQAGFPASQFDPHTMDLTVRGAGGAVTHGLSAVWKGTSSDVRLVTSVDFVRPSLTDQNPGNLLFKIENTRPVAAFRPDVSYKSENQKVFVSVRPRVELGARFFATGPQAGTAASVNRAFINEFTIAAREWIPGVSVAVKRDNQQWGPAYFGSPSNLFFPVNGRTRPLAEIHGTDFVQVGWSPHSRLSVEYLDNYGQGAQTAEDFAAFGEFESARAIRVATTFSSAAISFVVGNRSNDRAKYGAFGQWTASDALLLYFDTTFRRGSSALYPVLIPGHPTGGDFQQTLFDSRRILPEVLVGASYTTLRNMTYYLEYLYYGRGYTGQQAAAFSTIVGAGARLAAEVPPTPLTDLGFQTLGQAYFNGLRWRGRHHAMLQVTKRLGRGLDLVAHNVINPVDGSGFVFGSATWTRGRQEIILTGQRFFGARTGEYRAALNSLVTIGYQVLF